MSGRLLNCGFAALMFLLSATALVAQQPQPPRDPSGPLLLDRLQWVQFRMVAGRVVGSSTRAGSNMSSWSTSPTQGRSEKLSIETSGSQVRVQYDFTTPQRELHVRADSAGELSVRRVRKQVPTEAVLTLEQRPEQPIAIAFIEAGVTRTFQAMSLWKLLLVEPTLQTELVPVLEMLRPNWRLAASVTELEEILLRQARTGRGADRVTMNRLVDQLASEQFADREAASRQLLKAGSPIVGFLQGRLRSQLDAEQRFRIRALIEELSVEEEDSPERVAKLLIGDEDLWIDLLRSPDEAKRKTAHEHLQQLVGPVAFEPAANQAKRDEQVEKFKTGRAAKQ